MPTPFLVLASATFFTQPGMAANGHSMASNVARYGHVCAYNRCPLGRTLLVSRGGRRVRCVVVDRIGHGSDLDVYGARVFALLAGKDARRVGRVQVHVRVLGGGGSSHGRKQ